MPYKSTCSTSCSICHLKKLKGNITGCNLTGPGTVALVDDDGSLLIAVAWSEAIEKLLKPIEWRPKPGK